jgi:hypothetical protein
MMAVTAVLALLLILLLEFGLEETHFIGKYLLRRVSRGRLPPPAQEAAWGFLSALVGITATLLAIAGIVLLLELLS